MKKLILSLAFAGSLMMATSACNSTKNVSDTTDSSTTDSSMLDTANRDTTVTPPDTTQMPPDTTRTMPL
ncbi:coproporphyrinogen III oxidase [Pedobacter metabolipauper]|uniref:Coproporphyrinogen III oxidase n=1 Tax=Pedobacter metabolipauper TaxID=425513 RepID=A0A4R6T012_9SPHI|nr:coproporphyrinogen III oxidase [Pedobacter metabolipauper]TDQ11687.1 hypothetical protein ATK78_0810 [Pedobacter metabolipauper]